MLWSMTGTWCLGHYHIRKTQLVWCRLCQFHKYNTIFGMVFVSSTVSGWLWFESTLKSMVSSYVHSIFLAPEAQLSSNSIWSFIISSFCWEIYFHSHFPWWKLRISFLVGANGDNDKVCLGIMGKNDYTNTSFSEILCWTKCLVIIIWINALQWFNMMWNWSYFWLWKDCGLIEYAYVD